MGWGAEEGGAKEAKRVGGGQALFFFLFSFLRDRDLELHSRAHGSRH